MNFVWPAPLFSYMVEWNVSYHMVNALSVRTPEGCFGIFSTIACWVYSIVMYYLLCIICEFGLSCAEYLIAQSHCQLPEVITMWAVGPSNFNGMVSCNCWCSTNCYIRLVSGDPHMSYWICIRASLGVKLTVAFHVMHTTHQYILRDMVC
jgi:hypothetical protein